MLLDQTNFDHEMQRVIKRVCPKTFSELLQTIEACGKSQSQSLNPDKTLSMLLHMQVEEPWVSADPEEVAAFLAQPSNIQSLTDQLTMSAYHLGCSMEESGMNQQLIWPCLGCNTPVDGHSHAGDIPLQRARATWSRVSQRRVSRPLTSPPDTILATPHAL